MDQKVLWLRTMYLERFAFLQKLCLGIDCICISYDHSSKTIIIVILKNYCGPEQIGVLFSKQAFNEKILIK